VRASTVHEDETRHERIVFEGVKTKPKPGAITSHIQRFMTHHIPPTTSLNPPGHPPALVRADLVLSPVHRPGPGDVKTNDRETWGERAARGGRWDGPGPSRANVGDDGGEGEGGGGDGVTRGGARDDANGWDGEKGGTEGGDGGDGGERWRGERWATGDGMDDVGGFRERARANERWWRGETRWRVDGRRRTRRGGGRGGEARRENDGDRGRTRSGVEDTDCVSENSDA